MWRPREEIQADLNSGNASRISAGLRDLEERMNAVADEFEIPPPDLRLLQPFGDSVPEEVLTPFIALLGNYILFQPPLSQEERLYRMAELAVVCDNERAALEASLYVKSSDAPATQVTLVLDRLRGRGLRSEREVRGAGKYLSYMLAGSAPVRAATLAALQHWNHGSLRRAVEHILPELEAAELKMLSLSDDS
jgi:hypothetical protein